MSNIQAGDVVRLKSGGPIMTVKGVGEYSFVPNSALCTWFDKTEVKEAAFPLVALEKYVKPSRSSYAA